MLLDANTKARWFTLASGEWAQHVICFENATE